MNCPGFDSTSPFITTCNCLRKNVSYDNNSTWWYSIVFNTTRWYSIVFNSWVLHAPFNSDKAWGSAKQVVLHATHSACYCLREDLSQHEIGVACYWLWQKPEPARNMWFYMLSTQRRPESGQNRWSCMLLTQVRPEPVRKTHRFSAIDKIFFCLRAWYLLPECKEVDFCKVCHFMLNSSYFIENHFIWTQNREKKCIIFKICALKKGIINKLQLWIRSIDIYLPSSCFEIW